jgi:hypothetical protein
MMKRLTLTLTTLVLTAAACFSLPSAARADKQLPNAVRAGDGLPHGENSDGSGDLNNINVTYRGGALIENVQVSTLFMGANWQGNALHDYLNNFFIALFDEGSYMANLAQYSAGGYRIGNGEIVATAWDHRPLPATVTDDQVRAEVVLAVQAGALPKPGRDSLYMVYTAPGTVVDDGTGQLSGTNFYGYHGYVKQSAVGGFAYAIVAYPQEWWRLTKTSSHELAEAVTDPQVNAGTLGWYDDNNGEIGDIPVALYNAGAIAETDYLAILEGADGTEYIVQNEWSNQDGAPVSFAE